MIVRSARSRAHSECMHTAFFVCVCIIIIMLCAIRSEFAVALLLVDAAADPFVHRPTERQAHVWKDINDRDSDTSRSLYDCLE